MSPFKEWLLAVGRDLEVHSHIYTAVVDQSSAHLSMFLNLLVILFCLRYCHLCGWLTVMHVRLVYDLQVWRKYLYDIVSHSPMPCQYSGLNFTIGQYMYFSQNGCVDIYATCYWPLQLGKDKSTPPLSPSLNNCILVYS